ncbi:MAG: DUF1553 domain-containing protein [Planctomycetota bacterium]|nr:DUF1553 domain-containing protein [Planctomycetota bacterium]
MFRIVISLAAIICIVVTCCADETISLNNEALNVLQKHCVDCHGAELAESGLRLDSSLWALKGGDSGEKVIQPGNSQGSYLYQRVTTKGSSERMPPEADPLDDRELEILRQWINQSEMWKPVEEKLAATKSDHWSFQPLRETAVPLANGESPIDHFIDKRLLKAQLTRSRRAPRRQLIRRLHMVMHGMPPTPEQVRNFVADDRPDAWERLVGSVLRSPRYGERWAQHWLDLARFGETTGFETNRERPNAWPYRDWVINALNEDKPYDEFIFEQIAGDAISDGIGTAFLVAGPNDIVKSKDPNLTNMQRQDELADMINTTSTAFLGLTVGCARCHNHKFDPISQSDYYSLAAVFAGVNHAERTLPLSSETQAKIAELDKMIKQRTDDLKQFNVLENPNLRSPVTAQRNVEDFAPVEACFVRFTVLGTNRGEACIDELQVFSAEKNVALVQNGARASSSGDFVHPLHKLKHINDGNFGNAKSWISSTVSGGWVQIEFAKLERIERIVWQRDRTGEYSDRLATNYQITASVDGEKWFQLASSEDRNLFSENSAPRYDFAKFPDSLAAKGRAWFKQLQDSKSTRQRLQASARVYAGTFVQPGPTHRLYRGEYTAPREEVPPAGIASLSGPIIDRDAPEQQRRVAIAKWIANEKNPLTARIAVNRLWQFHFGTGIVDTPSDFGTNGTEPTHPELLDWLANELIENDWSLKHIQRIILRSETWQQASQPIEAALAIDADSRLLWRFPPRRLEGEGIRDCMLAVSGKLNPVMGGPGFSAFEIEMENVRHYFPKKSFGPNDWRRMVYMTRVRQERDSVFGVFDCPDNSQVTPKRSRSTTPLQALNLLNSHFVMEQAKFFAERLTASESDSAKRIHLAYELCFGREPDEAEIAEAEAFVQRTDWTQFARAMLNANEFVFIP